MVENILTDKGVMLVGEAAKSWVNLQWFNSILAWITGLGFVLGIVGVILLYIWLTQKEEGK